MTTFIQSVKSKLSIEVSIDDLIPTLSLLDHQDQQHYSGISVFHYIFKVEIIYHINEDIIVHISVLSTLTQHIIHKILFQSRLNKIILQPSTTTPPLIHRLPELILLILLNRQILSHLIL